MPDPADIADESRFSHPEPHCGLEFSTSWLPTTHQGPARTADYECNGDFSTAIASAFSVGAAMDSGGVAGVVLVDSTHPQQHDPAMMQFY